MFSVNNDGHFIKLVFPSKSSYIVAAIVKHCLVVDHVSIGYLLQVMYCDFLCKIFIMYIILYLGILCSETSYFYYKS